MHAFAILSLLMVSTTPLEPAARWDGIVEDESRMSLAPATNFVADAASFEKLWKAWRPDEAVPKINFRRALILVAAVQGPNRAMANPQLDDKGEVNFLVASTRRGGPGFGYLMLAVDRAGVRSVNGHKVPATTIQDSIQVEVVGTIESGIVAIGGETTGVTMTANGITWELDLRGDETFGKLADQLAGGKARARGTLERRGGVERGERVVVIVETLEAVSDSESAP